MPLSLHTPVSLSGRRILLFMSACLLLGCQQRHPLSPADPGRSYSGIEAPGLAAEGTLGSWQLLVDGTRAEATLTPLHMAAAGEQSYLLPLNGILPPAAIQLERVARLGNRLHLTYLVTHPFPGPDITKAHSAKNRADLGFAGRCVFGVDATATTLGETSFYGGEVILEPGIVTNADGYCAPGASLPFDAKRATAFPYQVVVDEAGEGNRVGLSNQGKATGNYQPSTGGWQRYNLGSAGEVRWTGYGFLHQGQVARRTLILDADALQARGGLLDVQVQLLAKYTDPRGGVSPEDRLANRLPPSISKPDKFLYRLPYAALDVSQISIAANGAGLLPNDSASSGTIAARVVDWDARATESSAETWSAETAPDKVPVGTAGVPTVRLDAPGVLNAAVPLTLTDNDAPWGGDAAADKGYPGDELCFTASIMNQRGSAGTQTQRYYPGVLEITDPEALLDRSGWELALGADLVPLTKAGVVPVTWQVVRIPVGDFGIAGCPDAPRTSAAITTAPAFAQSLPLNSEPSEFFVSLGPLDFASWRTPTYSGILFQPYHDGVGEGTQENYDLWSIAPATGARTRITNLGTAFKDAQISSLETDRTNRLIFSQLDGATLFSDVNLTYAYAAVDIGYLDYAGSPIATTPKRIRTGASRIVALTVDADNHVWAVDHQNRLRCFRRVPSGYQEDTAATLDLPTVLNLGTPFWVCDIAINFHNGARYLLIKPDDGGDNEGRVYRLECDGSLRSSVNGQPNPLLVGIYEYGGCLTIDNHAANGAVLTGQQDSQMLVGGYHEPYDLYVVTADLQITAQRFTESGAMEFQPEYCGTRGLARLEVAGADSLDSYTLPAGWQ